MRELSIRKGIRCVKSVQWKSVFIVSPEKIFPYRIFGKKNVEHATKNSCYELNNKQMSIKWKVVNEIHISDRFQFSFTSNIDVHQIHSFFKSSHIVIQ